MAVFDIYTRVSDEGGRSGQSFGSPEEQEAAARAWIERTGGDVGEVIYEGNVSGATAADDRRLGELIRRVEQGESSGVVVLYEDRFARDVIEGGRALQRIVSAGGRLIATATGFDSANLNPQNEMVFNVMMAIGQAQRKRNRENYIGGKDRAATRGVYCARAPFGYDRDEQGRLVPNDDAETVREIYQLRTQGVGFSELTRRFALPTRGTPRNIIHSRVYLGEQRVPVSGRKGDPKVIRDSHRPLITETEWEQANAVEGRAPIRRGLSELVKFKGLVKCATCGRSMSINGYGKDRDKPTYACGRKGCGRASMAALTLEPAVIAAVMAAVAANEPHVAATLADDDRYERALGEVARAQESLAEYRDAIELQQVLGIADFAAGLRTRREAVEVARRALRETPRPPSHTGPILSNTEGTLGTDVISLESLTRAAVAEVRVYPRTAPHRLTLRWQGSDEHVPLALETQVRRTARRAAA